MQNKPYFFFWKQGFPKGGEGGGVRHLGKIPKKSRFSFWVASLNNQYPECNFCQTPKILKSPFTQNAVAVGGVGIISWIKAFYFLIFREIHFEIWEQYGLKYETNTFNNLGKYKASSTWVAVAVGGVGIISGIMAFQWLITTYISTATDIIPYRDQCRILNLSFLASYIN